MVDRLTSLPGKGPPDASGVAWRPTEAALARSRLRKFMAANGISSLEELFAMARDLGVKMTACGMSMEVLGVERAELVDGLEYGGVGTYLAQASSSRLSLFI